MYRDQNQTSVFIRGTLNVDKEVLVEKVKETVEEYYDSIPSKVNGILDNAVFMFLGIKKDYSRFEIIENGPLYRAIQNKIESVLEKVVDVYVDKSLELLRSDKEIHDSIKKKVKDMYVRHLDNKIYTTVGDMAEEDGCSIAESFIKDIRQEVKLGSIHAIELEDPTSTPDGELGDAMLSDIVSGILGGKKSVDV